MKRILSLTILLLGCYSQTNSMEPEKEKTLMEIYAEKVWNVKNKEEYDDIRKEYNDALQTEEYPLTKAVPYFPGWSTVQEHQAKFQKHQVPSKK